MKVVGATMNDIESIIPLFDAYRVFYKQASDMEMSREFLMQRLTKNDSIIFLCVDQGNVVGFTQLYPVFSSVSCKRDYILNDLFVEEASRGKGVARELLLHSQQFVKAQGVKGLALETQRDNHAQFLYEKLGWEKVTNIHYYWTA
jgi:GNAT superfamily N-acetyltransferase